MDMTSYPMQAATGSSLPFVDATDEMNDNITDSIGRLKKDVGLFTRLSLQRTQGREAVKLAETALVELMAAKRRAFIYQVGLVEDHAKKLMLKAGIEQTARVEYAIARIIGETVTSFESLIFAQEEAAWKVHMERTQRIEELFQTRKISDRGRDQMVTSNEASTEKVVATIQATTREMLANLERRFHAALKQG